MKKTISINISGVIFHIEEDGYDKLRGYLTSIQHYFSTYEDSQEIITDIENRIAEKLLNKLKAAEKQTIPRQVVTLDDINELIQSMGTVADFEAIEEEDNIGSSNAGASRSQPAVEPATPAGENRGPGAGSFAGTGPVPPRPGSGLPPRKLYRDLRRKIAGGVASGIANYFNIDPVWVRLIFITLILALPPFSGIFGHGGGEFFGSISGFTVILYIAMWIAFPGSTTLEDDKSVKKFYRNPDDKVLGGVASGIGAYFGIDPGVVRLLFVLTIFLFGTGLLAYIVLWIISPPANTLTEKMEMQGEPITLSNIESNIKRSLDINETAEESTVAKILLFPFRLIATIFSGLASALGPMAKGIVSIVRVLSGVFLVVVGFGIMVAALGVLGTVFGLKGINFGGSDIPYMIQREITPPMILSAFVAVFLPGLAIAILGIMVISQRALVTTAVSLTLLCIWFLGLIGLAATIPPIINEFSRTGVVEETEVLQLPATIPTFDINDIDDNDGFHTSIELEGVEGASWQLLKRMEAQGPTRQQAQQNARTVVYNWTVKDSLIRFDDSYEIKPGARFRDQDIDVIIYIPYERPFRMTEAFARHIRNEFGSREIDRMKTSIWKFSKTDGLVSLTHPRERNESSYEDNFDTNDAIDEVLRSELGNDFNNKGEYTRQFEADNFSKIDMGGAFAVRVKWGETFKVVADGREEDIDELRVRVENNELHVDFRNEGLFQWRNRRRIGLTVTMPDVKAIHFSGATQSIITGFDNLDNLDIDLSGACKTLIDVKTNKLDIDLTGASKATLRGRSNLLDAQLSGACKLDATAMNVGRADVNAVGASNAEFGTVKDLKSKTSGASSVHGPTNQE